MISIVDAPRIRAARDGDSQGLISLIGTVFSEYPGCVLDVAGEEPELLAIETRYRDGQGRFWVAEQEGCIVGSVGVRPGSDANTLELKKLYVSRRARRRGLASRLMDLAELELETRSLGRMELWSDTRFEDAHRFYEGRGYLRASTTRELHDLSRSIELYFCKDFGVPGSRRE